MRFEFNDPLKGLESLNFRICDSHVHIWAADAFSMLETWGKKFGITRFMGIAQPDIKKELEKNGTSADLVYAYYLPIDAWAHHNPEKLLLAVTEAHELGYPVVKMWFGPRFLDYTKTNKKFSISAPIFEPVFAKIEKKELIVDIHVAYPDHWYQTTYTDKEKYRTKKTALEEFSSVLEKHPSMKAVSVHFGSLPEDLEFLAELLDTFPNLNVDTASTKWMIRELGKDPKGSRDFIENYSDRILFATDLSVGWGDRENDYCATRYWAQRIFWETNYKGVELPFNDSDNPNPPTRINGLDLSKRALEHIYWKNAQNLFNFE